MLAGRDAVEWEGQENGHQVNPTMRHITTMEMSSQMTGPRNSPSQSENVSLGSSGLSTVGRVRLAMSSIQYSLSSSPGCMGYPSRLRHVTTTMTAAIKIKT